MKTRLTAMLCLVAMLVGLAAGACAETMWVKTGNGRTLNLRSDCVKADNIIAQLPYGTEVDVIEYNGKHNWAHIECLAPNSGHVISGWVQLSFLSREKPGKYVPKKEGDAPVGGKTFEEINAAARAIKVLDEPYRTVIKTRKASNVVHLRMFPDTDAVYSGVYLCDTEIEVLAQSKTWAQVRIIEDGKVGFLLRKNVTPVEED
ncbi:MAG: hypothetical protein Q4C54_00745 [Clostridia bacterium]|nr:hypothetical protein [Clostridia bacterium]